MKRLLVIVFFVSSLGAMGLNDFFSRKKLVLTDEVIAQIQAELQKKKVEKEPVIEVQNEKHEINLDNKEEPIKPWQRRSHYTSEAVLIQIASQRVQEKQNPSGHVLHSFLTGPSAKLRINSTQRATTVSQVEPVFKGEKLRPCIKKFLNSQNLSFMDKIRYLACTKELAHWFDVHLNDAQKKQFIKSPFLYQNTINKLVEEIMIRRNLQQYLGNWNFTDFGYPDDSINDYDPATLTLDDIAKGGRLKRK